MTKMLSLLLAAVAVIAFAVPAFAQAAPELTIGGKKAAAGQTLTATSTNWTMQTSLGKLSCPSVAFHGVVSANTGGTVQIADDETSGNTKAVGCTGSMSLSEVTLTQLHTNRTGNGTFNLEFTTTIGKIHCTISTASSAFTYEPTASVLKIQLTNIDFHATPAPCEPATTNANFTVTSPSGVVVLH